jgi:hypothetical protein
MTGDHTWMPVDHDAVHPSSKVATFAKPFCHGQLYLIESFHQRELNPLLTPLFHNEKGHLEGGADHFKNHPLTVASR